MAPVAGASTTATPLATSPLTNPEYGRVAPKQTEHGCAPSNETDTRSGFDPQAAMISIPGKPLPSSCGSTTHIHPSPAPFGTGADGGQRWVEGETKMIRSILSAPKKGGGRLALFPSSAWADWIDCVDFNA